MRLQKFVCISRSSFETTSFRARLNVPTGMTMTPLSEIAYIMVAARLSTARPTMFSAIKIFSRTVRLSASIIAKYGSLPAANGGPAG